MLYRFEQSVAETVMATAIVKVDGYPDSATTTRG